MDSLLDSGGGVSSRARRRGFGVAFVVVMLVLVFLAITGIAIKYFTRGATRVSQGMVAGEEALTIARAALEESWAVLEERMNDPTDSLGTLFRVKFAPTNPPYFVVYQPRVTRQIFAPNTAIDVGDVELYVPREYMLWNLDPYEKYGQVRLSVTVKVKRPALKTTTIRTLRQWREYKVLYPSPPRPFDSMTLFVLNPLHLLGYEEQYRTAQKDVDDIIKAEERKLRREHPLADIDLPRPFSGNADVYQYFPNYKYPPFPYNARAPRPASYDVRPPLESTDMDNYLLSYSPELRGEHFKLRWPQDLNQIQTDPLVRQLQNDMQALQPAPGTSAPPDPAALAQMQTTLASLQASPSNPLLLYEKYIRATLQEYLNHFGWVKEEALPDFNTRYLTPLLNTDTTGTISVDRPIQFYREHRCTHVFPDQASLWREVADGPGRVFLDGIYYVDGPVDVNMSYRGRGTIIARSLMTVESCRKVFGPTDELSVCTLMSFCKVDGSPGYKSIVLNGDVEAGLVAVPGMIKDLHLHNVFGSVAVGVLSNEVVLGQAGVSFPWTLTYDPALLVESPETGAVRFDRSRVILSPTLLGTSVERK